MVPGNGMALTNLWRTRHFEYTWPRTILGPDSDFMRVTEEALIFATSTLKLDLPSEKRDELIGKPTSGSRPGQTQRRRCRSRSRRSTLGLSVEFHAAR